jgi:hypothetical protein
MRPDSVGSKDRLISRQETGSHARSRISSGDAPDRRQLLRSSAVLLATPFVGGLVGWLERPRVSEAALLRRPQLCKELFDYANDELGEIVAQMRSSGLRLRYIRDAARTIEFVGTHLDQTGFDAIFKSAATGFAPAPLNCVDSESVLRSLQKYDRSITRNELVPRRMPAASKLAAIRDQFTGAGLSPHLLNAADALQQFVSGFNYTRGSSTVVRSASLEQFGSSHLGATELESLSDGSNATRVALPLAAVSLKRVVPVAMAIVPLCAGAVPAWVQTSNSISVFLGLARLALMSNSSRKGKLQRA